MVCCHLSILAFICTNKFQLNSRLCPTRTHSSRRRPMPCLQSSIWTERLKLWKGSSTELVVAFC